MGVILPSEYQQVEFLEKPLLASVAATVYIDTGIITSSNIDYDFVGQALGDNETVTFFGAREAFQNKSNEVIYTLHHASVPTGAQFRYGNKAGATAVFAESPAINIHEVKRYKKEGTVFTCNNSSSTTAQQTFSYNKTITLFDVNQRTGIVGNAGGTRIYYFKLYESGVLVRDYIPCYRKADSEPGMYDLVSEEFFANAGTGEFVVGNDVIDSISPWLVARRRLLMRKPKLDTSPRIAQYGYGLSRSNTGITKVEANCYTEWYDVDPVATYQRTMTGSGVASGGANGYCFQTKTETGGNWDYWPNRKYLHANAISIRFTLITSEIDNAYVYCASGGQIFFAGKNTPYYGYTNINDMPTGT